MFITQHVWDNLHVEEFIITHLISSHLISSPLIWSTTQSAVAVTNDCALSSDEMISDDARWDEMRWDDSGIINAPSKGRLGYGETSESMTSLNDLVLAFMTSLYDVTVTWLVSLWRLVTSFGSAVRLTDVWGTNMWFVLWQLGRRDTPWLEKTI